MGQHIRQKAIRAAIVNATKELAKELGGQKGAAAATGLTQQTISAAIRGKVGWDLLLGLASAWDQTIDDLLARFGGYPEGRVAFPCGGLPGWHEAVEAARDADPDIPEWAWAMAALVRTPLRPARATTKLALACAGVAIAAGRGSGERPKLLKAFETQDG